MSCSAARARTALDLFTGTTRVAQAFKAAGAEVTAVDTTRYAVGAGRVLRGHRRAHAVDRGALEQAVAALNALPGRPGYVTETFCEQSRFFQPDNGARIDAVRDAIAARLRRVSRSSPCCSPACSRRPTGWTPPPGCRWPT